MLGQLERLDMIHEAHNKQTITSFKLSVSWSDGKIEGLAIDLPEYLYDELQAYFRELEDLREEHDNDRRDEKSSFGEDASKEIKWK